MAKDPICGMEIEENAAIKVTKDGKDYFFCSTHCKNKFIEQQGIKDAAVCYPSRKRLFFKHKLFIVSSLPALLIILSFFIPILIPFRKAFLMYLKAIWWAVLLGLFLGGLIDYYIPQEYISKILSRKRLSTIFNAVFLGFLMSACSHGILALSMQLHKKGASNPAVVSFLLASPWANFTITVMVKFAQGLARRKLTTAGLEAPFLCNCIDNANIPWLQALIKKPKNTALNIVAGLLRLRILEIYSWGI